MSEPMYCINHPNAETYLRCNKCGQPICIKCAVLTPVGYRCKDCVRVQQQVFYTGFRPVHYLVAAAVALPLALVAGWLIPSLGWYAIVLGPLVGMGIAQVAHWAIQRRRGQYIWLLVCACIVVGALPRLLLWLLSLVGQVANPAGATYYAGGLLGLLWTIVYVVAATGAAYARLRPGRQV
jgi:uncharacterized membrane protein